MSGGGGVHALESASEFCAAIKNVGFSSKDQGDTGNAGQQRSLDYDLFWDYEKGDIADPQQLVFNIYTQAAADSGCADILDWNLASWVMRFKTGTGSAISGAGDVVLVGSKIAAFLHGIEQFAHDPNFATGTYAVGEAALIFAFAILTLGKIFDVKNDVFLNNFQDGHADSQMNPDSIHRFLLAPGEFVASLGHTLEAFGSLSLVPMAPAITRALAGIMQFTGLGHEADKDMPTQQKMGIFKAFKETLTEGLNEIGRGITGRETPDEAERKMTDVINNLRDGYRKRLEKYIDPHFEGISAVLTPSPAIVLFINELVKGNLGGAFGAFLVGTGYGHQEFLAKRFGKAIPVIDGKENYGHLAESMYEKFKIAYAEKPLDERAKLFGEFIQAVNSYPFVSKKWQGWISDNMINRFLEDNPQPESGANLQGIIKNSISRARVESGTNTIADVLTQTAMRASNLGYRAFPAGM
jgi:hypothetical protein